MLKRRDKWSMLQMVSDRQREASRSIITQTKWYHYIKTQLDKCAAIITHLKLKLYRQRKNHEDTSHTTANLIVNVF